MAKITPIIHKSNLCDEEELCPFCGWSWESACDATGAPGCCQKAIDEYEKPI